MNATQPQPYIIYDGRQVPVTLLETRNTPNGTQVHVEAAWPCFRVVPSKSHLHPGRRVFWKDCWVMAEDVKVEAAPPTWADECLKASTLADAHQQEVIAELIELEFKVEEAAKAGDIALADEFINVIKILRPFVAIPF